VVIAGGGPTGMMLAAELALANIDGYVAWVGDGSAERLTGALAS
jgi:NADH dehydrogenase FAD-containing subunit